MSEKTRGIYGKYRIEKTDGSRTDPGAIYFTLRLDTDSHARRAVLAYIASVMDENIDLARDLIEMIIQIEGPNESNPFGIDPMIHHLSQLFKDHD